MQYAKISFIQYTLVTGLKVEENFYCRCTEVVQEREILILESEGYFFFSSFPLRLNYQFRDELKRNLRDARYLISKLERH